MGEITVVDSAVPKAMILLHPALAGALSTSRPQLFWLLCSVSSSPLWGLQKSLPLRHPPGLSGHRGLSLASPACGSSALTSVAAEAPLDRRRC